MAQLTLRINGYAYTVVCEDGQEVHLQDMAAEVQGRIDSIKAIGTQSGESKLLVLAALLMADELHDLRAAQPRGTDPAAPHVKPRSGRQLAQTIGRLADRAEQIATALEQH